MIHAVNLKILIEDNWRLRRSYQLILDDRMDTASHSLEGKCPICMSQLVKQWILQVCDTNCTVSEPVGQNRGEKISTININ